MDILRRALYAEAAGAALLGLLLTLAPGWLISWFALTPPPERAWMRLLGIQVIVVGMVAVLIARRLEEVWWWSWALLFGNAATATFAALKAALNPGGSPPAPWWVLAGVTALLAAAMLLGLGRAGQERRPE